jgi:hypothetical protein
MPWVGFEPTILGFERAKTVHALDRAATVIGEGRLINIKLEGSWKQTVVSNRSRGTEEIHE